MMKSKSLTQLAFALCIIGVALAVAGCPRTTGTAKVTLLLGSSAKSLVVSNTDAKAVVPVEDIQSLIVTVTEVTLAPEDPEADDVVLFNGSQDVDLISLSDLSQILSSADIPAGTYSQLRMEISDPRLALVSDPETELTNVKVTAHGHLFVSQTIEIPEGDNLIELSFNSLHLVLNGNGRYVLTPQLQVDLSITSADVSAEGTIASVNLDDDSMVVTLPEGDTTVLYGAAAIFLVTDAVDTPTGTEADLIVGASVQVIGTVDLDGVVTATEVHLLS